MKIPSGFKIPDAADVAKLRAFTRPHAGTLSCEYAPANLLCWGERYALSFKIENEKLWVYNGTEDYLYFPLGAPTAPDELIAASQAFRAAGYSGVLDQIPRAFAEKHAAALAPYFDYDCDPRFWDYVYSVTDLAHLPGEKYTKKRNLTAQFERAYPNWRVETLNGACGAPVWLESFIEGWVASKAQTTGGSVEEDVEALHKVYADWEAGGFRGISIVVDEDVAAFTIWSELTAQMADTHFEKALRRYKGGSQMINREMAKVLEREGVINFINREQDLGVEGLHQAKSSYMPLYQIEVGYLRPKK